MSNNNQQSDWGGTYDGDRWTDVQGGCDDAGNPIAISFGVADSNSGECLISDASDNADLSGFFDGGHDHAGPDGHTDRGYYSGF